MTGTVYIVGAGPGAPDLLTLRALRTLERADVVFHDALVPEDIVCLAVRAIKVPVGKRGGGLSTAQHFINKRLVDATRKHGVVVRLKGGDPTLFGRAHEEISYLTKHRIRFEIVPGITAALAASAELGVSLTRRGLSRSVALLTTRTGAGERPNEWLGAALAADSVAIYMGAGEARRIARDLLAAGKPPASAVAVIENASLPDRVVNFGSLQDLEAVAARGTAGPSLVLIGEVLRDAAIMGAWQAEPSSSSPTARVTRTGRARSGSSH